MTDEPSLRPIRIAIAGVDTALTERLVRIFASSAEFEAVASTEVADLVVTSAAGKVAAPTDTPFSQRELDVLMLLAEGASNKAIAARLGISVHTAKFHVSSVIDKLDAIGRTDAVAAAARLGVIHL